MDQQEKVANPARDQLNREMNFSLPPYVLEKLVEEFGLPVPSRASLLILCTQAETGAYSRDFSRFPYCYFSS